MPDTYYMRLLLFYSSVVDYKDDDNELTVRIQNNLEYRIVIKVMENN